MREGDLTYDDFLQRLNIQDVLIDAGYHLNRRDGLRYPSYVRIDSEGRRIRGDITSSRSSRSTRSSSRNTVWACPPTDW